MLREGEKQVQKLNAVLGCWRRKNKYVGSQAVIIKRANPPLAPWGIRITRTSSGKTAEEKTLWGARTNTQGSQEALAEKGRGAPLQEPGWRHTGKPADSG